MQNILKTLMVAMCVAGPWALDASAQVTNWGTQRWPLDVDRNGTVDLCRVIEGGAGRSIACTLSPTSRTEDLYAGRTIDTGIVDAGYVEGRAFADFNGDGFPDYCRIIGMGYPNSYAICTFFDGKEFASTVTSGSLDWGYPETRKWVDVNGDKRADFCRVVGNHREFVDCTLSEGAKGFGQTIRDVNVASANQNQ
jgi:hypothetical protein